MKKKNIFTLLSSMALIGAAAPFVSVSSIASDNDAGKYFEKLKTVPQFSSTQFFKTRQELLDYIEKFKDFLNIDYSKTNFSEAVNINYDRNVKQFSNPYWVFRRFAEYEKDRDKNLYRPDGTHSYEGRYSTDFPDWYWNYESAVYWEGSQYKYATNIKKLIEDAVTYTKNLFSLNWGNWEAVKSIATSKNSPTPLVGWMRYHLSKSDEDFVKKNYIATIQVMLNDIIWDNSYQGLRYGLNYDLVSRSSRRARSTNSSRATNKQSIYHIDLPEGNAKWSIERYIQQDPRAKLFRFVSQVNAFSKYIYDAGLNLHNDIEKNANTGANVRFNASANSYNQANLNYNPALLGYNNDIFKSPVLWLSDQQDRDAILSKFKSISNFSAPFNDSDSNQPFLGAKFSEFYEKFLNQNRNFKTTSSSFANYDYNFIFRENQQGINSALDTLMGQNENNIINLIDWAQSELPQKLNSGIEKLNQVRNYIQKLNNFANEIKSRNNPFTGANANRDAFAQIYINLKNRLVKYYDNFFDKLINEGSYSEDTSEITRKTDEFFKTFEIFKKSEEVLTNAALYLNQARYKGIVWSRISFMESSQGKDVSKATDYDQALLNKVIEVLNKINKIDPENPKDASSYGIEVEFFTKEFFDGTINVLKKALETIKARGDKPGGFAKGKENVE
ncbi:hypothetical protein V2E24_00705 [Mycoplasmopsis ciconiae]|uniref:Uncharacterized protein n=1 Tax=Mycoplasmopsis ciconiae TaxID=561067 RepID=A0ABU7MKN5_9BACT|nr:hypothetical protein [Mycoplasmopsis ciconiae]